ncbi:MAG TPA: phenylalanine--tRNA ligase subunit beta [Fibrobacteraceae bacterium]|nr:phenylalanine--tRNA ligase subunit beta [Fibrobacteraceae bacterium]
MKVSLKWLQRHVDLPESVDEISAKLTAVGLEVEGREEPGKVYATLIVAKVKECAKHPESDHLSITKVFDGKQDLQVICGAPNVAAGQTVCFAPIGSELPMPNGESLKIKKAKIRGVESFGMICAEDEIGLGNSHNGILVLPDHYEAGARLVDLGFYDVTLEINVTPNRPDALSHRGVARELAAAFSRELKPLTAPAPLKESSEAASARIQLQVDADCGCSRYVGRVIENVKVAPSPVWMQQLLSAVGLTPINNVVDVTNFVLFDVGQPLHSFDMDLLQGGKVVVRRGRSGESITAIDHKEYKLEPSDLVICDGDKPACVAGVMGGVESEITDKTTRVFLESAWFNPTVVRKQSKRLGLSSDSSYRFERHIDPFMQAEVSDYASALIADLAQGSVLAGRLEYTGAEHQQAPRQVSLRLSRIQRVVGISPSANEVRKFLTGIGLVEATPCACAPKADSDELTFIVPSFRPDLEREVDLIEEIARLVGFDNIPYTLPRFQVEKNELAPLEQMSRKIRHSLAAMGLHECLSLRFSSKAAVRAVFGDENPADRRTRPAALLNPLSDELGVLPVSQIPTLLKAVADNAKARATSVRLFEVGKGLFPFPEHRTDRDPGVDEVPLLGVVLAGQQQPYPLSTQNSPVAFPDIKGVLESLASLLRLRIELRLPATPQVWLHPHRQAEVVCKDVVLGHCGEIHPAVAQKFDISMPVEAFELDLQKVLDCADKYPTFQVFSRQVPTTRDVSIEIDERMTHREVMERIDAIHAKNLVDVQLKSVYTGDKLAAGRKNFLYQFTYQAADRTLTDEEVNKAHDKLREKLAQDGVIALR